MGIEKPLVATYPMAMRTEAIFTDLLLSGLNAPVIPSFGVIFWSDRRSGP